MEGAVKCLGLYGESKAFGTAARRSRRAHPSTSVPPLRQVYTRLLWEVTTGRELKEAVSAAAKDIGLDLGGCRGVAEKGSFLLGGC